MNTAKTAALKKIIIASTFFLVLISAIVTKQNFLLIIPIFFSLFIMALQSEANRYAYLAGGINALIYAGVYTYLGLYASVANFILISFPIQIATFLNWKKRAYGKQVVLRKMSWKTRLLLLMGGLVCFFVLYIVLSGIGSNYILLDNIAFILGTAVSLLTLFAFMEYSYLWLISGVWQVILNTRIMMDNPAHITYLIYSVYCLYCIIVAFFNVKSLYKEQQKGEVQHAN